MGHILAHVRCIGSSASLQRYNTCVNFAESRIMVAGSTVVLAVSRVTSGQETCVCRKCASSDSQCPVVQTCACLCIILDYTCIFAVRLAMFVNLQPPAHIKQFTSESLGRVAHHNDTTFTFAFEALLLDMRSRVQFAPAAGRVRHIPTLCTSTAAVLPHVLYEGVLVQTLFANQPLLQDLIKTSHARQSWPL